MERIARTTDDITAGPLEARIQSIRNMLMQEHGDPPTAATLPYERFKDWRTNLRTRTQNMDPVPGRFRNQVYESATGAMEDTAARGGMNVQDVRNIQGRTRAVEGAGGVLDEAAAFTERTPQGAYDYLLPGGSGAPARLQTFEALGLGDPRANTVMGNYIADTVRGTLGNNAPGAYNFSQWVRQLPEAARDVILGPQRGRTEDIATLARSLHTPTVQGGATNMVRSALEGGPTGSVGGALGAGAAAASSGVIPPWLAAAVGYAGPRAYYATRRGILNSDAARRGMLGQAARAPSIEELAATISSLGDAAR
jgi:hypothetical protein